MNLSTLRNDIAKVERGITAADSGGHRDLLDGLMARRFHMNMVGSHLLPMSKADANFLLCLSDELTEFVEDEPASESEKTAALEAIHRINRNLRSYLLDG